MCSVQLISRMSFTSYVQYVQQEKDINVTIFRCTYLDIQKLDTTLVLKTSRPLCEFTVYFQGQLFQYAVDDVVSLTQSTKFSLLCAQIHNSPSQIQLTFSDTFSLSAQKDMSSRESLDLLYIGKISCISRLGLVH